MSTAFFFLLSELEKWLIQVQYFLLYASPSQKPQMWMALRYIDGFNMNQIIAACLTMQSLYLLNVNPPSD